MKYLEARPLIQSGDLIFFGPSSSMFSRFEVWWTQREYAHCAIAVRVGIEGQDRLMVVEQHLGGQRIVTLSSYLKGRPLITVVKSPVPWGLYGADLVEQSGAVDYSLPELAAIGLREKFGLKVKDFSGVVCSAMIAQVLITHGIRIPTTQVSPGLLYRQVRDQGFTDRFNIES